MKNTGELIIYQPDATIQLEVRIENDTVWLTQAQIAELFGTRRQAITKHLQNIFHSGELKENSVSSILELTASDGKNYSTKVYNLDAIISVGYRVNSKNATQFRQWATHILKEHLLKGYTINQRIDHIEQQMNSKFTEYDKKFDFFIHTSLPPVEGIFFNGQIFDAYKFAADLIRSAKTSLILIDNYIDDTTLMLFTKRIAGVKVTIHTANLSKQLLLDLQQHNTQYPPIAIQQLKQSHDRFLIIDEKDIYHIGASLKDLGKKWFAFSKLNIDPNLLLQQIV